MQKIVTFLWFDMQAEEAANLYVSTFANSRITRVRRYSEGSPMPAGTAMAVDFQLEGRDFIALNGGPHFHFNEAISLFVNCESQAEVDSLWAKLLEGGGQPSRCGWLKDRFGLSWQIVPTALGDMLQDADAEKSKRVMQAMLQMTKLDVAALKRAYDGA
jgi:predicted 3-demethylubiquinone-9 3-methyltransferase (glyoxalase superfamily)